MHECEVIDLQALTSYGKRRKTYLHDRYAALSELVEMGDGIPEITQPYDYNKAMMSLFLIFGSSISSAKVVQYSSLKMSVEAKRST